MTERRAARFRHLTTQGLAGKVIVTGQDAELAALQRIAKGTQTMTIYKPIQPLAYGAVEAAIKLAKGETIDAKDKIKSDSMTKEVPAVLYEPIVVDKNNLMTPLSKTVGQLMKKFIKMFPKIKDRNNNLKW